MSRSFVLIAAVAVFVSACATADTRTPTSDLAASSSQSSTSDAPGTTSAAEPAPAIDAPELGGTSWNVTDYIRGSGTITNVWKTDVTISFAADGTVSGSAGCNDYQANWIVSGAYDEFESGVPDPNDGQELILGSLSWTEMACDDPAIMEQETEILDLLQRGARWVLIRGDFNLRDSDGAFLFQAAPA
ncbi:MAG: hypothetical protein BMS9Abin17_1300 [Acidimicrobiia bacterium]|nr:MAG: hypothetical protein BMS9Abin17_1300 [Acidimicrobiia bacterium]